MFDAHPMLEITDVVATRGEHGDTFTLGPINLVAQATEHILILGGNGAGKTTLLDVVGGQLLPSAGRICIAGENVGEVSASQRAGRVARVFQNVDEGTFSHLTVSENLLVARVSDGHEANQTALDLASRLDSRRHRFAHSLSGGERQLLAVAMQIGHDKAVVLLDEYLTSLDETVSRLVSGALTEFLRACPSVVLQVTHDIGWAYESGLRLIMLHRGRLIGDLPAGVRAVTLKEVANQLAGAYPWRPDVSQ